MTRIGYQDATDIIRYTDEDPENPGYMYGAWDGDLIPATEDVSWNKEHVWACSHMKLNGVDPRPDGNEKNHASDIHNLRVACTWANGLHGNLHYDEPGANEGFYPNVQDNGNEVHLIEGAIAGTSPASSSTWRSATTS